MPAKGIHRLAAMLCPQHWCCNCYNGALGGTGPAAGYGEPVRDARGGVTGWGDRVRRGEMKSVRDLREDDEGEG